MPYYVYETLGAEKERFEFKQSIHDEVFQFHPDTGVPIRKIIVAGAGIRTVGLKRSTVVNKLSPAATACGCASNAALAQQMYANSRETPMYGSEKSKRKIKDLKVKAGPSHSHGGGCCGHSH